MKPKIGITCHYSPTSPQSDLEILGETKDWNYLSGNYIYALEQAGAIPILLPIYQNFDTLNTLISYLDGFIFTGGQDISPHLYGQRVKQHCTKVAPLRDNRELTLASTILEEVPKPVLGIGRGMQLMNVSRGGSLYQDLGIDGGYDHHMCKQGPSHLPCHSITIDPHSKLAGIYGCYHLEVNSAHHQGISQPGKEVEATAHSTDGAVEAIELQDHPFAIGVQWHPEAMLDSSVQQKLFHAFVETCST